MISARMRGIHAALYVDEELKENRVIHLIRKVWNRSAIDKLVLVADVHIEILGEGSVDPDKKSVLIKPCLGPSHTDGIQVDKHFV